MKKGREKFCAPVRAVLAELNSPIKKKISREIADRRLREAGARTVWAVKDQLTDAHRKARVEWANVRVGDLLLNPGFFQTIFSEEIQMNLDPLMLKVRSEI